MEGILLSLNREEKWGRVDTRNDEIGRLTIYFQTVPDGLEENSTVEFDVVTSKAGNRYAKFRGLVDRNQAIFNTEDRAEWYIWGEQEEIDFVEHIVPRLGIDLWINPAKVERPWEIDLCDYTHHRYADLKTQKTPFFLASRYHYGRMPYDPAYTVTFNKKDYENYKENHPDCDIYFWVYWNQLEYQDIRVDPLYGVWRAPFAKMVEKIEGGTVALHSYKHRVNDDHNARESYLFSLTDQEVFERLL